MAGFRVGRKPNPGVISWDCMHNSVGHVRGWLDGRLGHTLYWKFSLYSVVQNHLLVFDGDNTDNMAYFVPVNLF